MKITTDGERRRIAIFGATGSIGRQSLDVTDNLGARVDVLTAGSRDVEFEAICRRYRPRIAAMSNLDAASRLKTALADTDIKVYGGEDGVESAAFEADADNAVIAISGMAASAPMMAAAKSCRRICMANKEAIVAAGQLLLAAIRDGGAELIPVDSEHSAIFQSLQAGRKEDVAKLILTASGGPFFGKKRAELEKITPADALAHPTWLMGPKITVDCAMMMNKGFEVIEAMHLFSMALDDIEVVVHRESVIHSMVEYRDGAVIAQLGAPDMRTAIQYAMTYPARSDGLAQRLDWRMAKSLTFYPPDTESFPLLSLAYDAARRGGTSPAVMSAADEVAVGKFLRGELDFCDIFDVVIETTQKLGRSGDVTLDEIVNADREARVVAGELSDRIFAKRRGAV